MAKQILLVSGPIASGKSTLAALLEKQFAFLLLKTWQLLKILDPDVPNDRESLQKFGEKMDRETDGAWVAEALGRLQRDYPDHHFVVDAVRIQQQIDHIRRGFGSAVKHVHFTADYSELERRYKHRKKSIKEFDSYNEASQNETERNVVALADSADVVINTDRNTPEDVLVRVASHLGLFGRGYERVVDVLVGGQYGSEGKGQIAAYLAPEYDMLIRVGGPNAGHSVYESPEPIIFHSLPSGTRRAPKAHIVLGAGAVVNPEKLVAEIYKCDLDPERLTIDPQVMIITQDDIDKEKANIAGIGSTGQGVGAATARRVLNRGVQEVLLAQDIDDLKPFVRPSYEVIQTAYREGKKIFLEGTQGTGLSLFHGSYPHVTSRDTTVAGCLAEAGISPSRVRKVIMVCRTYPIRVQNPDGDGKTSGPMSQELSKAEIARRSGIPLAQINKTETTSTTKRERRISEFDWCLLKKASCLNAPTDIALTFVDYISKGNADARRFEQLTQETVQFIQEVERVSEAPVSLISTRFHHRSVIDRRNW